VPLIAVTTDRPPELHHVGAPQTVEQGGLFAGAARWSVDPGVADPSTAGSWRSLAARCVTEAVGGPAGPGPVHLNLPFREPLLGQAESCPPPPGRPGGDPWHRVVAPAGGEPDPAIIEVLRRHAGGRGLIVAGPGADHPDGPSGALSLAETLGWPLFADPRSGCRVDSRYVVSAADPLLRVADWAARRPDAVLRLGPPWASKVLNQWLAALPESVPQVLADPWGRWADPERTATHMTRSTASALARALAGTAAPESEWAAAWRGAEVAARSAIDGLIGSGGDLELSEPAVAAAALAGLPAGGSLVVSSSMPVRDVEWYGRPHPAMRVLANRGANGIDGIVSTAVGAGLARPERPVVALVGDLAFIYDAGALLWAAQRPADLRLLVVDNDGGGIFSFLPQAAALPPARFERYWGTPHGIDLVALAAAYGVPAERITDRPGLDRFLARPGSGARVAVVASDRRANVAAHDRIHAAVAEAVTSPRWPRP
jgi:2-succinyl-5-enolpyruvyl-6-hydroxy-3-cyclohexene-1-carboxylate synthase